MPLTDDQVRAIAELPKADRGIIIDPTLMPEQYLPQLSVLLDAEESALVEHVRNQGWDDIAAGKLLGAVELLWTLRASGNLGKGADPG